MVSKIEIDLSDEMDSRINQRRYFIFSFIILRFENVRVITLFVKKLNTIDNDIWGG